MDDLCHRNQTLEDNVLHTLQLQQEVDPTKEVEMLNPHCLSNEIWKTSVPTNFKPPSLAKFDRCSDLSEHVSSINSIWKSLGNMTT